jgi:hypothetical protein
MLLPDFQISIIRGFLGKCKERRISIGLEDVQMEESLNV